MCVRFFFMMRKADSQLEFDLDLATKESQENPVYYVQYAHARLCSILAPGRRRRGWSGVALCGRRSRPAGAAGRTAAAQDAWRPSPA